MGTWSPGPGATAGADTFTGNSTNETVDGLGGADTLIGGGGEDFLAGGDGDDIFRINAPSEVSADDTYLGDAGNDEMRLMAGGTYNFAGVGINSVERLVLFANLTANWVQDDFNITPETWTIDGQGRTATFNFSGFSGFGVDLQGWTFTNGTFTVNLNGSGEDEVFVGSNVADTIIAGDGRDQIHSGGGGIDTLNGGAGDDIYFDPDANDIIIEAVNGGRDKIDVSQSWSLANYGTIEDLEGGGSAPLTLTGNGLDNILLGGTGADTLYGLSGNDELYGRGGNDTLYGGAGDDLYRPNSVNDVVVELANEGTDTVRFELPGVINTFSIASIANVENIIAQIGAGSFALFGNAANNVMSTASFSSGAITLYFDGGAGDDTMTGRNGNDTYIVDSLGDVVIEALNGGSDIIRTGLNLYSLSAIANVEQLVFTGTGAFGGTGNALNNAIFGGAANDVLVGGAGADYLAGGAGNDTYYVDDAGDNPVEVAGEGFDIVYSSVSVAITLNVEELQLQGTAQYGVGNAQANIIRGNDAANELQGLDGDDQLFGGAGIDLIYGQANDDMLYGEADNDALIGDAGVDVLDGGTGQDYLLGGAGDDFYYVDDIGDNPIEVSGEGFDVIHAYTSYAMTLNIEAMYLQGSAPYGVGNSQDNTIYGNASFNELQGLDGADTLDGGGDFDLLYGQNGDDTLLGGAGNDALVGGDGADQMVGGDGVDYLSGGADDDTYYVDNIGDNPIEDVGGGADLVYATVSYTLTANVETLNLANDALHGTGNDSANTIYGNLQSNELRGLDGDDRLIGGGATDFLYGGAGADTFVYLAATDAAPAALDAIMDFEIGVDKIDLTAVRTGGSDTFSFTTDGGNTFLHVDLGGNGSEDMLINIYQVTGVTAGDVLWGS